MEKIDINALQAAVDAAIEFIEKMAKPVSSKEEIAQVGSISANSDRAVGDLIADAMEKVGRDGVITVEEGKGNSTTLQLAEGMQFEEIAKNTDTNLEAVKSTFRRAVAALRKNLDEQHDQI